MSDLALPDKVLALDASLAAADIAHAFGGALALAYYAEPRATIDIDCNVFVPIGDAGPVFEALQECVAAEADRTAPARDDQVRCWWGRTPIDLFFAYDPFHDAMARAVRRVAFRDAMIPILGPEHLVVCKAVFDRRKDWIDIEQVLVGAPDFAADEVRHWLGRIVGVDDPRLDRFDDLATTLLGR